MLVSAPFAHAGRDQYGNPRRSPGYREPTWGLAGRSEGPMVPLQSRLRTVRTGDRVKKDSS
jgi:hypothetical protein